MSEWRIPRINSLLKQVLSEVIRTEVKNPHLPALVTITKVVVTKDLRHAKVYVNMLGEQREEGLAALQSAAGFIGYSASRQVTLRYFPALTFILDDTVDHQLHIDQLLAKLHPQQEKEEDDTP